MTRKITTSLVAVLLGVPLGTAVHADCTTVPGNGATPFVAGPVNPNNGFAEHVTDSNGLALEICLDAALCFFDPPDTANPFSVQVGFGPEAFWWLASAEVDTAGGGRGVLTLGAEAAWAAEEPIDGDQFPFTRLRIRVDVPQDGTYTVTHPYGTSVFEATAADGINDTIDIPFSPGVSNQGPVGPWLTWDATPPAPPAGFIGDGATLHTVTGSPCVPATNLFRIDAPVGVDLDGAGSNFVETNLFTVQGKLWDGVLATPLAAVRTTYQRSAPTGGQVDVFATGAASATVIATGDPSPPPGPTLLGSDASLPGEFFASEPITAPDVVPPLLALDGTDTTTDPTHLLRPLTDLVTITRAEYDLGAPAGPTLFVEAVSSDSGVPPTLDIVGLGPSGADALTPGGLQTAAPPAMVMVSSSAGGSDSAPVVVVDSRSDSDDDFVPDVADNCTVRVNPDQRDTNGDNFGNLCDPDLNGDGVVNFADLAQMKSVFFSGDPDADLNGDGAVNFGDLAIMKSLFFQAPGPSGTAP